MLVAISPESLAHHLRIAAERYDAHASILRKESPMPNDGLQRLAVQFERQAAECRACADALEAADSIAYNGGNIRIESAPPPWSAQDFADWTAADLEAMRKPAAVAAVAPAPVIPVRKPASIPMQAPSSPVAASKPSRPVNPRPAPSDDDEVPF